jgi:hypothetical protein
MRFDEEVKQLAEEKRCVLASLEMNALDWDRHHTKVQDVYEDPAVIQGAEAYTAKQAAYQCGLKTKFHAMWLHGTQTIEVDEGAEVDDDAKIIVSYAATDSDNEAADGHTSDASDGSDID